MIQALKKIPRSVFGWIALVLALIVIGVVAYSTMNDPRLIGVIIFLFPLLLIAFFAYLFAGGRDSDKLILEQMSSFAEENGFEFEGNPSGNLFGEVGELELFQWGESRKIINGMQKQITVGTICLFVLETSSTTSEGNSHTTRRTVSLIGRSRPNGIVVQLLPQKGIGFELFLLSIDFYFNKLINLLTGKKQRRKAGSREHFDDPRATPETYRTIYRDQAEESYSIEEAPGVTLTTDMLVFLAENPRWSIQSTKNVIAIWKETSPWDDLAKGIKRPWESVVSPTEESLAKLVQFSQELASILTQQE